jgi:RNA-splicing ligase RtcB
LRNETAVPPLTDEDLPDEVRGAGGTAKLLTADDARRIDMERAAEFCRDEVDGEAIEANLSRIRQVRHDRSQDREENRNTHLDYLEGSAVFDYLIDMSFCQTYAYENRRYMAELVAEAIGVEVVNAVHSPHNLIDPDDLVIRKGATRAHQGEWLVVPYNMGEGSVILSGEGNDDWNCSAPHGAGRRGSRKWARDEFSMDEFEEAMDGVYSTSVSEDTLDESPMSYKDPSVIEDRLDETGEIVDRLTPIINCKADW